MLDYDLLPYQGLLKLKTINGRQQIWDPIRRKWITYGPEEVVRQLTILYLLEELKYPARLIHVEKQLEIHHRLRRFDLLLFDRTPSPLMLVECKRPEIDITQATFDQISRYNIALQVPYLLVTNGEKHFCCAINYEKKSYAFLSELPAFLSNV